MKLDEAVRQWVSQFNEVPQSILSELIECEAKDYEEIYCPLYETSCKMIHRYGSCQWMEDMSEEDFKEIYDSDQYDAYDDCPHSHSPLYEDFVVANCRAGDENRHEDSIPMWATLFQPNYWDRDWFRDNAQSIYEDTGVLVFDNEHYDVLIGMNSAGHDFYDAYWKKLYLMRGLQWHDEE